MLRPDDDINLRYLNAIDRFTREEVENANKAADYWYHNIGANVIHLDWDMALSSVDGLWSASPCVHRYNSVLFGSHGMKHHPSYV
jgi:hypothetical protein